jgi:hypothetical protein
MTLSQFTFKFKRSLLTKKLKSDFLINKGEIYRIKMRMRTNTEANVYEKHYPHLEDDPKVIANFTSE